MTSRQRFAAACEHRPADRVPVHYLAHPEADRRLRERVGCATEAELLDALGCDFFYLPGRDVSQNEGFAPFYRGRPLEYSATERVCPLGIRWRRGAYASKFAVDEPLAGPLENAEHPQDILSHPWPTVNDFDFSALVAEAEAYTHRVIIGGLWTGILGDSYRMYGFEHFLLDMALQPRQVHTLVDRMAAMYLELNDALFSLLRGKLDVWFFGNDFGHQWGLLFREEMWDDFFRQNITDLTDLAHSHGLRVMAHSCGAIAELIPHLIDAGVDILDPVQVSAAGMDPGALKAQFGDRLVFHGGIDTQQILPTATPHEAAQHAQEIITAMNGQGGYILAPSQIYQEDIPTDNILAIYERTTKAA